MATVPTFRIHGSVRGGLAAFAEDRLAHLDRAASLGPLAGMQFGRATVFVVSDGDLARQVLVTDGSRWSRPPSMRSPVRLAVGENLFTLSDRKWAAYQPTVAPSFRSRSLAGPLAQLDEIVASEVASIPLGRTIDLDAVTGRLALVVAAWVILGDRLDAATASDVAEHQRHVVEWVGHRLGALSSAVPFTFGRDARAMRLHRRALEQYVDGAIARTRPRTGSRLGAVASSGGDTEVARRRAGAHVLGLMLAGNETTAAALSWMLVHAAANPAEWSRLSTEPERAPAFVAEVLRLNPSAWGLTRTPARRAVEIASGDASVRVRRPGVVTVYLRAIHRDARHWADPLRFSPDRHLVDGRAPGSGLIPFGLGNRGCIGQHLALAELHAAVPALARLGTVEIDGPVEEDANFSLRVKGGLRGRFVPVG